MGAIKDLQDQFTGNSNEDLLKRELVAALDSLARLKAETIQSHLAMDLFELGGLDGHRNNLIRHIIDNNSEVFAIVEGDATPLLQQEISQIVEQTVQERSEVINTGISNIIGNHANDLLSSASAHSAESQGFLFATEFDAIIRIDYVVWFQEVQNPGLLNNAQKIAALVLVKSSVDVNQLDLSTFVNVFSNVLSAAGADEETANSEIEKARATFDAFRLESVPFVQNERALEALPVQESVEPTFSIDPSNPLANTYHFHINLELPR